MLSIKLRFAVLMLFLTSFSIVSGGSVKKVGFVIQKDEVFSVKWDRFEKPDDCEMCLITSSNPNNIRAAGTTFERVISIPNLDFSAVEAECIKFAEERELNLQECYFTTHDEYALELCAALTEKYQTYGNDTASIKPFRDKVAAKALLQNSGVPLPKHLHYLPGSNKNLKIEKSLLREKVLSELGFPIFIKPVNEARCKDVHKITSIKELDEWLENHPKGDYEVDEFINGDLYTAMSVLQKGEIVLFGAHKFLYPCFEFMNQKKPLGGYTLSNNHLDAIELKRLSQLVFSKMPLKDGVVHIEFMKRRNNGEFVFIEAAARQPGGYISDLFEKAKGLNLGAVHYALQMQIPISIKEKSRYSAAWFWPNKPKGKVKSLEEPKISSQYELLWRVKEGDILKGSSFLGDSSYRMLLWNKNLTDLLNDLDTLENIQNLVNTSR